MKHLPAIFASALACLWLIMTGWSAFAEDPYAGSDPQRREWFRSLTQPGNGASCCDISDCSQTRAEQRPDGSWRAIMVVNETEYWVSIPPDTVLKKPLSIDGEAYLCHSSNGATIYCFIPPVPGF